MDYNIYTSVEKDVLQPGLASHPYKKLQEGHKLWQPPASDTTRTRAISPRKRTPDSAAHLEAFKTKDNKIHTEQLQQKHKRDITRALRESLFSLHRGTYIQHQTNYADNHSDSSTTNESASAAISFFTRDNYNTRTTRQPYLPSRLNWPTVYLTSTHKLHRGGDKSALETISCRYIITTVFISRGLVPPAETGQHSVISRGVCLSDGGQQRRCIVLALGIVASCGVALHGAPD